MGSTCTIVELPRDSFSTIFPPDPTPEIGKIQKHYDYPRFWKPVVPVSQGGNCWTGKSFWDLGKIFGFLSSRLPKLLLEASSVIPQDSLKILVLRHFSSMRTLAREGS